MGFGSRTVPAARRGTPGPGSRPRRSEGPPYESASPARTELLSGPPPRTAVLVCPAHVPAGGHGLTATLRRTASFQCRFPQRRARRQAAGGVSTKAPTRTQRACGPRDFSQGAFRRPALRKGRGRRPIRLHRRAGAAVPAGAVGPVLAGGRSACGPGPQVPRWRCPG